jgi:hypothetical protein
MLEYRSARIAALNDRARRNMSECRVVLSRGVTELDADDIKFIMEEIQRYSDFTPANDPYGERDFGVIDTFEFQVCWKFDYYDLDLSMHSPDPSDPTVTLRVLTVMMMEEY